MENPQAGHVKVEGEPDAEEEEEVLLLLLRLLPLELLPYPRPWLFVPYLAVVPVRMGRYVWRF